MDSATWGIAAFKLMHNHSFELNTLLTRVRELVHTLDSDERKVLSEMLVFIVDHEGRWSGNE